MYKIVVSLLLIFACYQNMFGIGAKCMETGNLYVNQKLINNGDAVLIKKRSTISAENYI